MKNEKFNTEMKFKFNNLEDDIYINSTLFNDVDIKKKKPDIIIEVNDKKVNKYGKPNHKSKLF